MRIVSSSVLFVLAGVAEIGGGYLVWLWLREGRTYWYGLAGAVVLVIYGVLPTLQPATFGRVYAAYGGIFVVMSVLWGWRIDGARPDGPDLCGALMCLLGAMTIFFWPRG